MTTYNVFRAENRGNGTEEWVGTVDAVTDEEALDTARAEYECNSLHHLYVDACETTVCDHQIQHDRSGVGHCWRNIDREDIPASIVEEIEAEIIDGGKDECDDFIASNGQHYRW